MIEVIERVLTMSAQAGTLILCLLLVLLVTRKHISLRLRYGLWLLPATWLVLPFTFHIALFSQAERERYGMALLSIIRTGGGKPNLVNATTTISGSKRELRERIGNIGKRPKTLCLAVIASVLCMAVTSFAACTEANRPGHTEPPAQEAVIEPTPTPVSKFDEAKALASGRHYPQAMALLAQFDTEEAKTLLSQLRYIVNGDYIGCAGWTVAALTAENGVNISTSEALAGHNAPIMDAKGWSEVTQLSVNGYSITGITSDYRMLYASKYTPE